MTKTSPRLDSMVLGVASCLLLTGCGTCDRGTSTPRLARPEAPSPALVDAEGPETGHPDAASQQAGYPAHAEREQMVQLQLAGRDITDARVLAAMRKVPRHLFVAPHLRQQAYADYPLPIDHEQTISQPYIVAFMTQALQLDGSERVLEIGTGSGYQAAVLAELCREVYSIEIIPELSKQAAAVLAEIGVENVHLKVGDGYRGWPEEAPFDGIMVTAAPSHIPQPLVDQLAAGGRMILPVGELDQDLVLIERSKQGITRNKVLPVRFVPMTGDAQKRRR